MPVNQTYLHNLEGLKRRSIEPLFQGLLRAKVNGEQKLHTSTYCTSLSKKNISNDNRTRTVVSGSGILTPLKKTLERKTCWWRGIRSPDIRNEIIKSTINHKNVISVCVSDLVETFVIISTIMHVSFCTHRQMISWCGLLLTYQEFFEWGRAGQHQTSRATVDFHVAAQQRHSQEPTHLQEDRTEYLRPAAPGRGTSGSLRSLCSHPLVLLSVRQREITCTDTHTLKYWIMNTK